MAGLRWQILLSFLSVSVARDDVNIEFVNECNFDVNMAWYETKCQGREPNVLYLNQRLASGQRVYRTAPRAARTGGRVYGWAAEDQSPGTGMSQSVFANYMTLNKDQQCASQFAQYRFDVPPFAGWAAFAELTLVHNPNGGIVNDADISMVDQYYLPMSWDWIYSDLSALSEVNQECYNTSLKAMPTEADCNANGGHWNAIPATPYAGAPSGYCRSPNALCGRNPEAHAVCSADINRFQNLILQLEHIYGDLQADTLPNGAPAFKWEHQNRSVFPGQVWTCAGFQNAHKFRMAEMCAAINRGMCDLSSLGSKSAADFASWTQKECGSRQNQKPESEWFVSGNVYNPFAYWLRRVLQGTTYAFSQDEGIHGGNSNCNNINPGADGKKGRVPDRSRVTFCPGSRGPGPSPSPSGGWKPCGAGSVVCCNPNTSPRQKCPGPAQLTCQDCGAASCECPSSDSAVIV